MADSSPTPEKQSIPLSRGVFSWINQSKLPNPGSFEQLHKEVRGVFPTNFMFDGAKFEFNKMLSPTFQVQHSFALGSQSQPQTYSFGTVYANDKMFLNGTVDHEGNLQGRANYTISPKLTGKMQTQMGTQAGQAMVQAETDYSGGDFSVNLKAVNPSPVDATGIYVASYLQSVTKNLVLGTEVAIQRPTENAIDSQVTLIGKLSNKDQALTVNLSQMGILQMSYFHRVNEKVELGTELQMVAVQDRRDAVCTIGGKWEFRQSVFRGQLDTSGRVGAVLEERMGPGFSLLFSADLDHMKGQSKFGLGFTLEN